LRLNFTSCKHKFEQIDFCNKQPRSAFIYDQSADVHFWGDVVTEFILTTLSDMNIMQYDGLKH